MKAARLAQPLAAAPTSHRLLSTLTTFWACCDLKAPKTWSSLSPGELPSYKTNISGRGQHVVLVWLMCIRLLCTDA